MAKHERRSILCPNCRKLISADEPRCPHCGTSRPGAWWKNNVLTRGFRTPDRLIRTIICVNIGMYLLSLALNPRTAGFSLNPLTSFSPGSQSLVLLGATGTIPIERLHRWWSLVSATYLHGGILHILFNMVAFWQLAPLIIREYGMYRLIIIYTLSGVLGYLLSFLAGVTLTIGASASLCGLIGAALYFGRTRGGIYGSAVYKQIGGWAIGIFIFGLLVPGINNWGHGGGIVAGAALGFLLGYQERKRENVVHKLLAGGCMAVTVVVLGWAILTSIYYRLLG